MMKFCAPYLPSLICPWHFPPNSPSVVVPNSDPLIVPAALVSTLYPYQSCFDSNLPVLCQCSLRGVYHFLLSYDFHAHGVTDSGFCLIISALLLKSGGVWLVSHLAALAECTHGFMC